MKMFYSILLILTLQTAYFIGKNVKHNEQIDLELSCDKQISDTFQSDEYAGQLVHLPFDLGFRYLLGKRYECVLNKRSKNEPTSN